MVTLFCTVKPIEFPPSSGITALYPDTKSTGSVILTFSDTPSASSNILETVCSESESEYV